MESADANPQKGKVSVVVGNTATEGKQVNQLMAGEVSRNEEAAAASGADRRGQQHEMIGCSTLASRKQILRQHKRTSRRLLLPCQQPTDHHAWRTRQQAMVGGGRKRQEQHELSGRGSAAASQKRQHSQVGGMAWHGMAHTHNSSTKQKDELMTNGWTILTGRHVFNSTNTLPV